MLLGACVIQDLNQDMNELENSYGFFKAQVEGGAGEVNVIVALVNAQTGDVAAVRTIRYGELVYVLLPRGNYVTVAFEDTNGDYAYQPGEAAARISDPVVSWFADLNIVDHVDIPSLPVQVIEVSTDTILPDPLDLSLEALHSETKSLDNLLRVVT